MAQPRILALIAGAICVLPGALLSGCNADPNPSPTGEDPPTLQPPGPGSNPPGSGAPSSPPSDSIVVSPTGNDTTGNGTAGAPYRTLTKATQVVSAGGTIHLLAGTYGAGETWPTVGGWPSASDPANIPAGVSVIGDPGTVLSGSGAAVALYFAGNGSAQGLEITGFQRGVLARAGSATLTGLNIHDNLSDGIFVFNSGHVDVVDTRVSAQGWGGLVTFNSGSISTLRGRIDHNMTGVYANDSGSLVIWQTEIDSNGTGDTSPERQGGIFMTTHAAITVSPGTHIHGNRYAGIYAAGDGNLSVSSTEIDHNGTTVSPLCSGVYLAGNNPVTLSGGSVHDNRMGGVTWYAGDSKIDLQGGIDIYGNQAFGVYAGGTRNGFLRARNTTIRENLRYGLAIAGSPGSVDFGSRGPSYAYPGNNAIRDNRSTAEGTAYQIRDSRTAANSFSATFYQTAVGVNNPGYPAAQDVWSATGNPAVAAANLWQIDNTYVHLYFQ